MEASSYSRGCETGPRDGQGVSGALLSTHRLFGPVEPRGVLPGVLQLCPHGHLAPAVLCPRLWGWLQAAEGLRLLWTLGRPSTPLSPATLSPPWDGKPGSAPSREDSGSGAPWKGDAAASPVCTDVFRLHLDRTELPRTILQHGGMDSVEEVIPSLPGPTPRPGVPRWRREGSRIWGTACPAPSAHCSDGKAEV